jgi:hypothetical protein
MKNEVHRRERRRGRQEIVAIKDTMAMSKQMEILTLLLWNQVEESDVRDLSLTDPTNNIIR